MRCRLFGKRPLRFRSHEKEHFTGLQPGLRKLLYRCRSLHSLKPSLGCKVSKVHSVLGCKILLEFYTNSITLESVSEFILQKQLPWVGSVLNVILDVILYSNYCSFSAQEIF